MENHLLILKIGNTSAQTVDMLQVPLERKSLNWINTGYLGSESHKEEINKRH